MAGLLLAYTNLVTAIAVVAGGSYAAALPVSNLKTLPLAQVARSSNATMSATRIRVDLTASYPLRAMDLAAHNLSTAAKLRLRLGASPLDLWFDGEGVDDRITCTGGVNGTRINSAGQIVAAVCPRIDYHPSTLAARGLLVESASTNACPYSEQINSAGGWGFGANTTQNGQTTTLLGRPAYQFTSTSSAGGFSVSKNVAVPVSTSCAVSFYCNVSGSASGNALLTFPASGRVLTNTATITLVAPGVYLYEFNFTTSATENAVSVYLGRTDMTSGNGFIGTAMQVEARAKRTSYIPTTSAAVTRTGDRASITGANFTSWYSSGTGGTIYAEAEAHTDATCRVLQFDRNDGSYGSLADLLRVTGGSLTGQFQAEHYTGGVAQAVLAETGSTSSLPVGSVGRGCTAWNTNDFSLVANGVQGTVDNAGALPAGLARLALGYESVGDNAELNGWIKRVVYWPTRLTNAQMVAITSLAGAGPEALADTYNSGWVNALQLTFQGTAPANWGSTYDVMHQFPSVTARYASIEIDDRANAAGYVQYGRLFLGGGFQPAKGASFGLQAGLEDLSSVFETVSGAEYATERDRRRTERFSLDYMTLAEGDRYHEMGIAIGTVGEVVYIPDIDDMARSQRYGGLGTLRELGALDWPIPQRRSVPIEWKQKK